MNTGLVRLQPPETSWSYRDKFIIVGKDILEVLSSAMYVDPLAIYREYLQNAADAIEARRIGALSSQEAVLVEIELDLEKRTARIRDNGTGISAAEFETRMTSFGASAKRGTNARGFRGVGRLSGLGYCQELLFRSRSAGESKVIELHWGLPQGQGIAPLRGLCRRSCCRCCPVRASSSHRRSELAEAFFRSGTYWSTKAAQ